MVRYVGEFQAGLFDMNQTSTVTIESPRPVFRTGKYVKTGRKVRRLYDEHRNPFHWVDEQEFVPDDSGKVIQSITWSNDPPVVISHAK
jgi:hypothetical protein